MKSTNLKISHGNLFDSKNKKETHLSLFLFQIIIHLFSQKKMSTDILDQIPLKDVLPPNYGPIICAKTSDPLHHTLKVRLEIFSRAFWTLISFIPQTLLK